jgi:hypothetical protein
MKHFFFSSVFLLSAAFLNAQEEAAEPATLLSAPVTNTTPAAEPTKLEVTPDEILATRTIVRPDQKITIQRIVPQNIDPLPAPPQLKELSSAEKAERTAKRAQHLPHRIHMLSCTVHHLDESGVTRTHLRWSSQGKDPVETFEAWSNVNFAHLSQTSRFQRDNTIHNCMFGIAEEHTRKAAARALLLGKSYAPPTIPTLPNDSTNQPSYIVTAGNPTEEDLAAIDGLHELYQKHHAEFIAAVQRLNQENEKLAAELAANPPDPTPDLLIRYWTPEKTLVEILQEQTNQKSKLGGESK